MMFFFVMFRTRLRSLRYLCLFIFLDRFRLTESQETGSWRLVATAETGDTTGRHQRMSLPNVDGIVDATAVGVGWRKVGEKVECFSACILARLNVVHDDTAR